MLQIKIIDEAHEQDCTESVNQFLKTIPEQDIIKLDYAVSHFQSEQDQVFSFSVCILYRIEDSIAG